MKKCGNIVDLFNKKIFKGCIEFNKNIIRIEQKDDVDSIDYILPGFIDSHVHVESSMLIPSRFSKLAIKNGTIATVSDPHEIANVLGEKGINFMIKDAEQTPLKIHFGVPSCVPATNFETSGDVLDSAKVKKLITRNDLYFLAEVMNFPGVINRDKEVMAKIEAAKLVNKRIDGHAPGLRGEDLDKYISAGIETDHEAYEFDEALEKIKKGMKILIREGSAAKNFESLYKLIDMYPDDVMLCTDDSHPDDLVKGHINKIVSRAVKKGLNLFNVLRAATVNPVLFYGLKVGLLRINDPADFIVVNNLEDFDIKEVFIDGKRVFSNGQFYFELKNSEQINNFNPAYIKVDDIKISLPEPNRKIRVIKAFDGDLLTEQLIVTPKIENGYAISDVERDILKIVVLNRYFPAKPSVGFINGFGLKKGAIALSIAHDSHNIVALGVSEDDIVEAVNKLIDLQGGIVVNHGNGEFSFIKLPYAGLMTDENPFTIAEKYETLNKTVQDLGSKLKAPFMTLSFMSLLVIPKLKLGDKGLFDVTEFKFVDLFI